MGGFGRFTSMALSSIAIAVITAPYAVFAHGQAQQISWIAPFGRQTLVDAALLQYTEGSIPYLLAATIIILAALVVAVRRSMPASIAIVTAWGALLVLIPTVVVLTYSALVTSTYVPRYMSFTCPGIALVLAAAICTLARRREAIAAFLVVALAIAAIPAFLAQRAPYGRAGGSDFSQVADFIGDHARPGDCVAFEPKLSWSPTSQRIILRAKPVQFRGLRDLGPQLDAIEGNKLFDDPRPDSDYAEWAKGCSVVWVVTDGERRSLTTTRPCGCTPWFFGPFHFEDTALFTALNSSGLTVDSRREFNHSQVVRMTRPH